MRSLHHPPPALLSHGQQDSRGEDAGKLCPSESHRPQCLYPSEQTLCLGIPVCSPTRVSVVDGPPNSPPCFIHSLSFSFSLFSLSLYLSVSRLPPQRRMWRMNQIRTIYWETGILPASIAPKLSADEQVRPSPFILSLQNSMPDLF